MTRKVVFIAFVVSLGGFLFGFDAGIISGVMSYVTPEFDLSKWQEGWVVSSPSVAAMLAMLVAGKLSNVLGRKKLLISVAFLYAISALFSAYAYSFETLVIARMIGGLAFGAALVLAPMYIAEISSAKNRGKLVSLQQLNIVLGFFAAFLSNYYFNEANTGGSEFLTDENVWRWMLGVEFIPAIFYFIFMFFVPMSPRWLYTKNLVEEARKVLSGIYGEEVAIEEIENMESNESTTTDQKVKIIVLLKPAIRYLMVVGLVIGVLQQITGINAIYFYATSIFKQTGIGTNAAFTSGVLLSFITVVFTFVAIFLIDKMGRRPLLLIGIAGIATSLLICAYGFNQAKYELTKEKIAAIELTEMSSTELEFAVGQTFANDVAFKDAMKENLGTQLYAKNEGAILEGAISINATLVFIGILGFIACFAFSLGPVMWVLLSELFPIKYRGLAIGFIGFINSLTSTLVQLVFPWELSTLGNATTFLIFGIIAALGFFIMLKILPETKGKSLEEIEKQYVNNNLAVS